MAPPSDSVSSLVRLSISLPADLFLRLDAMASERAVSNRSQLIAELIRAELAAHSARERPGTLLAGSVTVIYAAEGGRLRQALAEVQAAFRAEIVAGQTLQLDEAQAMEVLLVRGPAHRLHALHDGLRQVRGVRQCRMITATAMP